MKASQLKSAILQLAVQGKLVPQDPTDEPAGVLLERIRAEKAALVGAGKVKKDKKEAVIDEEELPFEVPESWVWVRLGELVETITSGSRDWAKYYSTSGAKFLRMGNLSRNSLQLRLDKIQCVKLPEKTEGIRTSLIENDLLFSITGEVGLMGLIPANFGEAYINQHTAMLRFLPVMRGLFLPNVLLADYAQKYYKETQHGIKNSFRLDSIAETPIPLPPLAEQRRIVAKIEELLPHIAAYDAAEQKLTALNTAFPDALKKSILQAAVQGKLADQDPADEPASVLLDRIRAEKAALVKAGKAKKDKNESVIFRRENSFYEISGGTERCIDNEIPFDVPDSWGWVRLGDIVFNHGQMTPQNEFCYIDIGSIDNKHQQLNAEDTIIAASKAPSRARKIVEQGDILYSTVRPYLHNMCIVNRPFSLTPIASTGFAVLACFAGVYNRYLFMYLQSPDFDNYANDKENSKGVAYPAINDTRLYRALIPLPPLAEQHRIVARIEELTPLIDKCAAAATA